MANERLFFLACNIYSILAEYSLHSCTFRCALWPMRLSFTPQLLGKILGQKQAYIISRQIVNCILCPNLAITSIFKTLDVLATFGSYNFVDVVVVWCFTALRHFSGHFGRGQLKYPHCFSASLQFLLRILSPVTDNCLSWISGRERMAVEIISWPIFTKECCRMWGSNPRSSAYQVDAQPTELPRPA